MKIIEIPDINSLPEAASEFLKLLQRGRVYAFRAPMGAGKTTLISEICRQLNTIEEASSPTFSIINEYETAEGEHIYHFDCYRLESAEEGYEIGAEDYFNSGRTCFVEWPENIEALLPEETVEVEIQVKENGERQIIIHD